MDLVLILKKAGETPLTEREKEFLAMLAENEDQQRLGEILIALGQSNAVNHKGVVEKCLNYTKDNSVPAYALRVLCMNWGLSAHYLDVIKNFIRGSCWDEDGEAKLTAIMAAGYYLSINIDVELVGLLIDVCTDESEDTLYQSWAYEALAIMAGKADNEMPDVFQEFSAGDHVGGSVLEFAKNIRNKKYQ